MYNYLLRSAQKAFPGHAVQTRAVRRLSSYLSAMLVLLLAFSTGLKAQVSSNYTVSASSSGSFIPITGGTLVSTPNDNNYMDDRVLWVNLPTNISFNGSNYGNVFMSSNGFIMLPSSSTDGSSWSTSYTPISSSYSPAPNGIIAPLANNLMQSAATFSTSEMRVQQVGNEVVFQWRHMAHYSSGTNPSTADAAQRVSFQARVNTVDGTIKFVYGEITNPTFARTYQVGIRGNSTADYLNRTTNTTGNWAASTIAGTSAASTCSWNGGTSTGPSNGMNFTFTPTGLSAKSVNNVTYSQETGAVTQGATQQAIMRVNVDVAGSTGTLTLDTLRARSNNTNDGDVVAVRLYRTTDGTFLNPTLMASTTFASGVALFTPAYSLTNGQNYFWVAYDVSGSAANGNNLDVKFNAGDIKIGGSSYPPFNQNPSGTRTVSTTAMAVNSINATHPMLTNASRNTLYQQVLKVAIDMGSSGGAQTLTGFNLDPSGMSNISTNVQNARVYYTGSSDVFTTNQQYGSTVGNFTGTFSINGNLQLPSGMNYFWVLVDVKPMANVTDSIDLALTSATFSSSGTVSATSGNPSGVRKIKGQYCLPQKGYYYSGYGGMPMTSISVGGVNETFTNTLTNTDMFRLGTGIVNLTKKVSNTISIGSGTYTGTNRAFLVMIDYNQNGTFEYPSEAAVATNNNSQITPGSVNNYNFTVPCSVTTGYTRMRVISRYFGSLPETTPCLNFWYGNAVDYDVNISDSSIAYALSYTTQASTAAVLAGSVDQQIIRIGVVTSGCSGTLPLTQLTLNTTGTTTNSDIDSVRVYYTGNSSTFATTTRFGATASISGNFNITGNVNLLGDTNYFHVVFDVDGLASNGNTLDAQAVSVVVNGNTETPVTTNPSGSRTVSGYMTYNSVTVNTANVGAVPKLSTNKEVISVVVNMSSGVSVNLTTLNLGTTGSSNAAGDIQNARVFYTGNSSTYATTTQFGSTSASPNGAFTVSGTAALTPGDNYFWVAYDIRSTATTNNVVDAICSQITVNGSNYSPTTTAPTGNRKVIVAYCNPSCVTVSSGYSGITQVDYNSSTYYYSLPTTCANSLVDATSTTLTAQKLSTNQITVTTGGTITGSYQQISVHVDWNQDGDMDDAGETLGTQLVSPGSVVSFNITPSCAAALGSTRLRVREQYNYQPGTGYPCNATYLNYYLHTIDYSLNVTDSLLNVQNVNAVAGPTSYISKNTTNNQIIRVQVVNAGCSGTLNLSDLYLNTTGSSDPNNDVDSIKVFYTGNSNTFAMTTRFGQTGSQNGAYVISGSQNLLADTNNFWVVYDINSSATNGNLVDAQCTKAVINGTDYNSGISSPTGSRTISDPMTYSSSELTQTLFSNISRSTNNGLIAGFVVNMSAGTSVNLDSVVLNTTGTTSTSDITNARLWFTGNSSSFATTTQFGSTIASVAAGEMKFGSVTTGLLPGANHVWLTYDITAGATLNNKVDAQAVRCRVNGTNQTPTTTTVSGDRAIMAAYCNPIPYYTYGGMGITNVVTSSFSNATSTPSTTTQASPGYNNYTGTHILSAKRKSNQTITVTTGSYGYQQNVGIFIDYNQDGDFTDAGERVVQDVTNSGTNNPNKVFNLSFQVPCSAPLGSTRMRVTYVYYYVTSTGNNVDPCAGGTTYYYMEAEDYGVVISDSTLNYISSNVTHPLTSAVGQGSNNVQIATIPVVVGGCSGTLNLTNISLNTTGTNGTNNASTNITAARAYWTGNSSTLSFTTLIGTATSPNGAFNISGSQALIGDTNWIHIVYDVSGSSNNGDTLDVTVNSLTIGGNVETPTTTSPAGFRIISSPMSYVSHSWGRSTSSVSINAINAYVVQLGITMSSGASLSVDSFLFNTSGSTGSVSTNIQNARLWFTGSSSTFAATTQYGSTIAAPNGNMRFTGGVPMVPGVNYYWLTYDIRPGANYTTPDSVTGIVSTIWLDGSTISANTATNSGKRRIMNEYCNPIPYYTYGGMGITNVTTNSFSKTTGTPATTTEASPGFNNYTSTHILYAARKSNQSISVTTGSYGYQQNVGVFIDYNQDGDFTDAGERVVQDVSNSGTNNPNKVFNMNFQIPCSASLGQTRMRVTFVYYYVTSTGNNVDPCTGGTTYYYMEAEDYGVEISDSALSYIGSTVEHPFSSDVPQGSSNVRIATIPIYMGGCSGAMNLTNISLTTAGTNGTNNASTNLTAARAYYTGTSSSFSTTTQFGSAASTPSGSFSFSGTQALVSDTNYIHIVYDIDGSANNGDTIDVAVNSLTVGGSTVYPTVGSPSGYRIINSPMSYVSHTWNRYSDNVFRSTTNNYVARVAITMTSGASLNLDSIRFNTNGSTGTLSNNISNAKVFFTGNSSSFANTSQYGSTIATPNGSLGFTGSAVLLSGVNYFWLAYDVLGTANYTTPDSITGDLTQFTINGTTTSANTASNTGKRRIRQAYCDPQAYNYNNGMGITQVITSAFTNTTPSYTNVSESRPSYNNFTGTHIVTTARSASQTVTVKSGTYGYQNMAVFVDFNADGDFSDAGERVGQTITSSFSSGVTTQAYTFTVPCSAEVGSTRMRVISSYYQTSNFDACASYSYAEYEDYGFYINDSPRTILSITNIHPSIVDVNTGTSNVQMSRILVRLGGCTPSYTLTAVNGSTTGTNGSNNPSTNITDARCYFTGSSATFATTTQFGSTASGPSGTLNFTGSQALTLDSNYFWVIYNVSGSAAIGDTLDYSVTNLTINGNSESVSNNNPTGYRLISNPMTYVSSSVSMPITGSVFKGSTNNSVIRVAINMSATGYPINLDSLYFATTGTANVSTNIQNAKVFYTGNNSNFAATTQFGTTISAPSTTMLFSRGGGNFNLMNGLNYFWLSYDIKTGANTYDSISGLCDSVRISGVSNVPSPSSVTTKRNIMGAYCVPTTYYYAYGNGITNVQLNTINQNNSPLNNSATTYNPLRDYTSVSTTLQRAGSYAMSVTAQNYTTHYVGVWIDWNIDGDWADAGEFIGNRTLSTSPATAAYTITVPCSAVLGTTRMRVWNNYYANNVGFAAGNSCNGVYQYYGEAHDYTINLIDSNRMINASATHAYQATTADVAPNTTNQQILRCRVSAGGCGGTLTMTDMDFNTDGTTPVANITSAKVYYTGTSNTFNTTTQFGSTVSNPSGSFTFNGSQVMSGDSAFFWLVYDISGSASTGDDLDAEWTGYDYTSSTLGALSGTPATTDPSGIREVNVPMTFNSVSIANSNTANVEKGKTNQEILRIEVNMSTGSPQNLAQVELGTTGTNNPTTNLLNAKLWYTGTSSTFATTTQYGSTYTGPNTGMTFNGTTAMTPGTNYFWLTYDIKSGATAGDYVDAGLTELIFDSSGTYNYQTVNMTASGNRKIINNYCGATYSSFIVNYFGIDTFKLNSFTNITSLPQSLGASHSASNDYTTLSTTIKRKSNNSVTVGCGTYTYGNCVAVWIDYNQDGDWSDAGERVAQVLSTTNDPASWTMSFQVPCDALLGSTRMRVRQVYSSTVNLDPCATYSYGEAEDYTVVISDSAMSYNSTVASTNITTDVFASSVNNEMMRVAVVTTGCSGSLNLSQFNLNTTGSTAAASDIDTVKVWYTGSSNVFATTTLYGYTTSIGGSVTVNGSQNLLTDTTNFWVTYSLKSGATVGDVVDAGLTSLVINGGTQTLNLSPSGSRTINSPMTYSSSAVALAASTSVTKGSFHGIMRLAVNMGTGAPVNLTSMTINTTGSDNISTNVDSIRVYYTGTSSTYAATSLFGTKVTPTGAAFTITGTQALAGGTNYFWVAYKVKSTATTGDSLTGLVSSIVVAGNTETPSPTAASGKRKIIPAYCTSSSQYTIGGFYIGRVEVASQFTHTATNYVAPPGYSDLTSLSANAAVGSSFTVILQAGTYNYGTSIAIFVDFNADGDFNDAGEKVGQNNAVAIYPSTTNMTFTIPNGSVLGTTRMRVKLDYANTGSISPCGTYNYGETKDFTLNLTAPASPTPTISPSSASFCQGVGQTFATTLTSGYQYLWKVNGSTVYSGTGSPYHQYFHNPGYTGVDTITVTVTDLYAQSGTSGQTYCTINAIGTAGTATVSSPSICAGTADTLNLSGYNGTIQWQEKVGTGSWTNISMATISQQIVYPTTNTQYRAAVTLGSCGTVYSNIASVSMGTSSIWTGFADTNWYNPANWCSGGVPISTSVVVIQSGGNQPTLWGNSTIAQMTINSGATLKLINGANLTISGTFTRNGTLNHLGGYLNLQASSSIPVQTYHSVRLQGTSTTFTIGGATTFKYLTINSGVTLNLNSYTVTVNRDMSNSGTVIGSGKILFDHSTFQTLSGTNGKLGNVELSNGSSSGGVRISGNQSILGTLTMNSGLLVLNPSVTLTIGAATSSVGTVVFNNPSTSYLVAGNSAYNSTFEILGNASAAAITGFYINASGNLTINRPNGVTLGGNSRVGAVLTVANGTLNMNGFNLVVGATGNTYGRMVFSGSGQINNTSSSAGRLQVLGASGTTASTGMKLGTMYNMQYQVVGTNATLGNSMTIRNSMVITSGTIGLNNYTVTLNSTASLSENGPNKFVDTVGSITTSRTLSTLSSLTNVAGMGLSLQTASAPGNTTITRRHSRSTSKACPTCPVQYSILRNFTLSPTNYSGLVIQEMYVNFDASELNSLDQTTLSIARSINGGTSWTHVQSWTRSNTSGDARYVSARNVTLSSANTMFTAGDSTTGAWTPELVSTDVKTIEAGLSHLNVYPNPFNDQFNVSFNMAEEAVLSVRVMDINGKVISQDLIKAQAGMNSFNYNRTAQLASGVYFISVVNNDEVKTLRVIKQ